MLALTENFKKPNMIEGNHGILACYACSFLLKGGLDQP